MTHERTEPPRGSDDAPSIANLDVVALALRLTVLALMLRPIGDWMLRPTILGLAASVLIFPSLLLNPKLWGTLTALTGLRVAVEWQLADNHAYLLCYWCLAVTLALVSRDPRACLALNGRLLIGWAFAFATLWKLLSPDYLDGRFFRVTLLIDPRFAGFAQLAGGLAPEQFEDLSVFVRQHIDVPSLDLPQPPVEPQRFRWLAWMLTWWTVGIEGITAAAFLWPVDRGISRLRHILLLVFCATTYAVATVAGFGWLLLAMGVAQCDVRYHLFPSWYLLAFGLILLYRDLPWAEWLLRFFSVG